MSYYKVKNFSIKKDGKVTVTSSCSNDNAGYSTDEVKGGILSFILAVMDGNFNLQGTNDKTLKADALIRSAKKEVNAYLSQFKVEKWGKSEPLDIYTVATYITAFYDGGMAGVDAYMDKVRSWNTLESLKGETERKLTEMKAILTLDVLQTVKSMIDPVINALTEKPGKEPKTLFFGLYSGEYITKITSKGFMFSEYKSNALQKSELFWKSYFSGKSESTRELLTIEEVK
jgi:hypothetical protein